VVPTKPALKTVTLTSKGVQDGWVLESFETSSAGGSVNADETTFRLGDDEANKQYRAILHFDTSVLPDDAVITKVILRIQRQTVVGTDPFTTHGDIWVDIREGAFKNDILLQPSDFQAMVSTRTRGLIQNNPAGNWFSTNLLSTTFRYINVSGSTQFRLRFALDDNNDLGADFIRFFSGNAAAANRPKLVIQYYVP
jgi:hypothetical protein